MANDVTIVVEASLGDTLLKLELAKHAIGELDDAGTTAGRNLGDDSNRNSFSSRIRNLRNELGNIGDRGPLGRITRGFGNLGSAMLAPLQIAVDFTKNMGMVGQSVGVVVGIFASLVTSLGLVAAAMIAVVFAAEALASILGTLIAITADLVAPVTIVVGLLGGLAVAFGIGAKRAAEGGGKLNEFSKIVDTLGSMFGKTSNILAHVFLPYLVELGHAAETALNFLDKVVKLPLGQAFRLLDTQGTKLLGQFVDRVAEVLSKPIRLAFRVAFDDTAFSNMVSDWWHRFTGFLFGEVKRNPIRLPSGRIISFDNKQVDGIFQPLIDWFNRHHFTRQGIQIGQQILRGVMNSGMRNRLGQFFADVFGDAMRRSVHAVIPGLIALLGAMRGQINRWGQQLDAYFARLFIGIWNSMKSSASSAWNAIASTIRGIWNRIVSFIESPLSISIDWPSPPSWLMNLPGSGVLSGIGGGISGLFHTATGTGHVAAASPRGMGSVVIYQTNHIHGADLSDAPTRRRIVQRLGKEIAADWRRRADGH